MIVPFLQSFAAAALRLLGMERAVSAAPSPADSPAVALAGREMMDRFVWDRLPSDVDPSPRGVRYMNVLEQVAELAPEPMLSDRYRPLRRRVADAVVGLLEPMSAEEYRRRFGMELRTDAVRRGGAPLSLVLAYAAAESDTMTAGGTRDYFERRAREHLSEDSLVSFERFFREARTTLTRRS